MTILMTGGDKIPWEDYEICGAWVECWKCGGEGSDGHDCGEDCCMCLYPEDNLMCEVCNGAGGWNPHEER